MKNEKDKKKPSSNEIDIHRAIVLWLFLATLTLTVFVAVTLIIQDSTGEKVLSILPVVILAGVLGSFVSALNRIYSSKKIFPTSDYSALLYQSNRYLIAYASIPPLVGAISAAILYVVFASEIIESPFFPSFSCERCNGNCNNFQSFLTSWSPTNAQDYAKAIVWGFISGFCERFVPDILNKVVKDSR
ncbi:hypothetical protein [Shewanella sp.]|uniref:hypothetical protein n=1 Tax=Shewanella sp. TaxID=50422 RepID=UPI004053E343